MTGSLDTRKRWLALVILCLGELMIVLDTTIVNVRRVDFARLRSSYS